MMMPSSSLLAVCIAATVLFSRVSTQQDPPTRFYTIDGPSSTASSSISPVAFGADPNGERDSTDALQHAIDLALNATKARSCGNIGDPACGAALVDLKHGVYSTSRPLNVTGNGGNWRICCGSLLAAPSFFPRGGYLISVRGANNGHQNIGFHDLSLDGGLVANGLFLLNVLRGEVSELYCLHFFSAGVTVEKGHEVDIHDSFLGQYIWDEKNEVQTNSTAIVLLGNDHFVHDCVIFSSTGVGILDSGGANGIEGVHIYGAGGLWGTKQGYDWRPPLNADGNVSLVRGGIVLLGWGWQSRVVNNYFDGEDLVLQLSGNKCCPEAITGNMFLAESKIVLRPDSNDTNVTGLSITSNLFAGLGRCHDGDKRGGCTSIWVDQDVGSIHSFSGSTIMGNSCSGGRYCVSTTASRTLRLVNATEWVIDFGAGGSGGSLLHGLPITRALYSLAVEDNSFPRHHMLPLPNSRDTEVVGPPTVTVVTDMQTTATVTVQVSQEAVDVDYVPAVGNFATARRLSAPKPSLSHGAAPGRRSAAERVHEEQTRSSKRLAGLR